MSDKLHTGCQLSLWRNWLARSAVNRKVGGSSPPRDGKDFFVFSFFFLQSLSGLDNFTIDNPVCVCVSVCPLEVITTIFFISAYN